MRIIPQHPVEELPLQIPVTCLVHADDDHHGTIPRERWISGPPFVDLSAKLLELRRCGDLEVLANSVAHERAHLVEDGLIDCPALLNPLREASNIREHSG